MRPSFKRLLFLVLGIFLLVAALFVGRQTILAPYIEGMLLEQARTRLGLDLAIGRVSGTYFSCLELAEVRTVGGTPKTTLTAMDIDRLTVRYSLSALLTGSDAFLATTRITVEKAFLQIDIPENGPQGAGLPLPKTLPDMIVRNSSLRIRTADESFSLNGLTVSTSTLQNSSDAREVSLTVAQATLPFPGLVRHPLALGMRLVYTRDSITVESLELDRQPVLRSAFLELRDGQNGRFTFNADLLLFAGTSRLQGRYDNSRLTGRLTVQDISLEAFPAFLQKPSIAVGGLVNGQIDLDLDPADIAELTGSLNLRVQKGRLLDLAVPQLDLTASAADGLLSLQQLQARSDTTLLTLHNAAVPLAILLDGKPDAVVRTVSGRFTADSRNLGPLLSAIGLLSPEQERVLPPPSLSATGSIKGGYCNLDTLTGRLGNNSLDLDAVSFSLVDMFLARTFYQGAASARGDFLLQVNRIRDFAVLTDHILPLPATAKVPDHVLTLAGHLQDGTLTLSRGSLKSDTIDIDLRETAITLPYPELSLENIRIRSKMDLQIADLSQLDTLVSLGPVSGSLHGRVGLDGPLPRLNGSLQITGAALRYSTIRIDDLQTRATATGGDVVFDTFEAKTGEDLLSGHGSFNLAAGRINHLSLQLAIKEINRYLGGFNPANQHLEGALAAGLEAHGPWSAPEAKLFGRLTAGRYNGIDIREATVFLKNSGRQLSLTEARFNTSEGNLTLSADLFRADDGPGLDRIKIQNLDLERNAAKLSLAQPVDLSLVKSGALFIDNLVLTGTIGRIEGSGSFQPGGNSALHLRVTGLTGNGWLASLVSDRLYFNGADFTLDMTGDLRAPHLQVQGTVAEIGGRGAPHPFRGTVDVGLDEQGLDFRTFQWIGRGGQSTIAINGRLPFDPFSRRSYPAGTCNLTASLELPDLRLVSTMLPPGFAASGSLHTTLFLQGTMTRPRSQLHIVAEQLTLPPAVKFLPPGPFGMTCDLQADPDRYSFSTLRLNGPSLTLTAAGDWLAPPPLTRILTGQPPLRVGALDMTASLIVTDFSWAAGRIEAIRRLDGQLAMEASLSGPVENPTLRGTVHLTDGELRTSYAIQPARNVDLQLAFATDQVRIVNLNGELGGAPFSAAGVVQDYTSPNPTVDLVLKGENLLLYRAEGINIRSDVDLKVQGPLDRLAVSGGLGITSGRFTRNVDILGPLRGTARPKGATGLQLFSFHEPPLNRAALTVRIETKKAFLIKNNLAHGSFRPDILLTGTGELPVMIGVFYLDPVKIKMPSGFLNLESGVIRFSETDPDRPLLDMTGKATIMGYEITILIQGSLDEPVITLSSSPPLPDDELLLLVLTGKPPKSGTDLSSSRKGSMNIALYLGRSILDEWFNSSGNETDDSILERFELEIGRGITRLGEETIDARFRLAEGLFRDDDLLFITAQKDIFDAINAGLKIVFRFQ